VNQNLSPETTVIVEFLAQCLLFDELSPENLENCARNIKVSYFPSKHRFQPDKDSEGLYVLRSGVVDIFDDRGMLLQRVEEGEGFRLKASRDDSNDSVISVLEDCLVFRLPEEFYQYLCGHHRQFDCFFEAQASLRLRRAEDHSNAVTLLMQPVRDWMSRTLLKVDPESSIQVVAQQMSDKRVSSALVVESEKLVGIVTDRDLRSRCVAPGLSGALAIRYVMTTAPSTVSPVQSLFDCVVIMMRYCIHHLPVAEDGCAVGIVTASDISLAREEDPLFFVQRLSRQSDVAGLSLQQKRLPRLFQHWANTGIPANHISHLSNMVSETVTRRLIELAIQKLGPAPVEFCWLSFGSQARGEQLLGGDQDNGLLIADNANDEDMQWFSQLADFVCDGLDACGYIFCPGDVMAKTGEWRQTLSSWMKIVDRWMENPTPDAVMRVSIFFDLRAVWGPDQLALMLHKHMLDHTQRSSIFLAALARNVLQSSPPLGILRRFVVERNGEHRDQLNLKTRGALPIIELVRLRALANGVGAVSTVDRLRELGELKVMGSSDVESLQDAFALISRLRVDLQAKQLAAGEAVNNYCDPRMLSKLSKVNLRDAFKIVHDAQASIRLSYLQGLD
jgi:CBS domain-containing protein